MADICLVPQVYNAERFVFFWHPFKQKVLILTYTFNKQRRFLVQLYSHDIRLLLQVQSRPGEVPNYQKVKSKPRGDGSL